MKTIICDGVEYDYIDFKDNNVEYTELLSAGGDIIARIELYHNIEQGTVVTFDYSDNPDECAHHSPINYFEMDQMSHDQRAFWMAATINQ